MEMGADNRNPLFIIGCAAANQNNGSLMAEWRLSSLVVAFTSVKSCPEKSAKTGRCREGQVPGITTNCIIVNRSLTTSSLPS